jgi:nitrogen fixation/metabolism regulation signal transduction histidine kinase
MTDANIDAAPHRGSYEKLLLINGLGMVLLLGLILQHGYGLLWQYRRKELGSRLAVRMVVLFIALGLGPMGLMYYYSLKLLHQGIDSWFNVQIGQALQDSLDLSRAALATRMTVNLKQTQQMLAQLGAEPPDNLLSNINQLREQYDALELTLFDRSGRIVASSSANPANLVPKLSYQGQGFRVQLRTEPYAMQLLPDRGEGLLVQVAVQQPEDTASGLLVALFGVPERLSVLADSVREGFEGYNELAYSRESLKLYFTVTLSLVLALSALAAVWAAFFSTRRLIKPIRVLAAGTQAVAAGDYNQRLPVVRSDDLGALVASFNEMTRRLARARDETHRTQREVEEQRSYLAAILSQLTSGIITFDLTGAVRTFNPAVGRLLDCDLDQYNEVGLDKLASCSTAAADFVRALHPHFQPGTEWQGEILILGSTGRQVLLVSCVPLQHSEGEQYGYLVVFEIITSLVQAQRDEAWSEVARRLAHEIKNPLTPIQLSAERMRRRCLPALPPAEAEVLDKGTKVIIQQVDALKEMVNDFSQYARSPQLHFVLTNLNHLVSQALELYRSNEVGVELGVDLAADLPDVQADPRALLQVIHNLIKNALEALQGGGQGQITLTTRHQIVKECHWIELQVVDNGAGFPQELLGGRLFEPYVTTKVKGTGLGLAIVKRITADHGGMIEAYNRAEGGGCVTLRLPLQTSLELQSAPLSS